MLCYKIFTYNIPDYCSHIFKQEIELKCKRIQVMKVFYIYPCIIVF